MNGSCRAETVRPCQMFVIFPKPRLSNESHMTNSCCCASDFCVHRLHSGELPVSKSLQTWCPISQLFSLSYQCTTCQTLAIKMSATKISCLQKEGKRICWETAERFRFRSMRQWPWCQHRNTGYWKFFIFSQFWWKSQHWQTDCLGMFQSQWRSKTTALIICALGGKHNLHCFVTSVWITSKVGLQMQYQPGSGSTASDSGEGHI